jgi:hypothetical protein
MKVYQPLIGFSNMYEIDYKWAIGAILFLWVVTLGAAYVLEKRLEQIDTELFNKHP